LIREVSFFNAFPDRVVYSQNMTSFLLHSRFRPAWLVLLLVGWGGGCRTSDPRILIMPPSKDSVSIQAEKVLPPAAVAPEIDSWENGYTLQPGDEIDLQVYREPELSGTFRIVESGDIRHPLLGSVTLGGLTQSEAGNRVIGLLGEKYLVNPRVILKMVSTQSSHCVILGEVKSPGVYPIPIGQRMTLLQAIARAGGFTELASPDRIRIMRQVDGKQVSLRVRVSDILAGKGQGDISLEPRDVISVPQIIF